MAKQNLIFVGSRLMMSGLAAIPESLGINIVGILDSHYYGNKEQICGIPVIGDERWLLDPTNQQAQQWKRTCVFFPANWHDGDQHSGLDQLRLNRINLLDQTGVKVINLIHPDAVVTGLRSKYGSFKMGRGIQVQPGVIIQADNVHIGDYAGFENGCSVTHDVQIGRNFLAAPRSYIYNCSIGNNSYMGIFSRINAVPGRFKLIEIGDNVTVWHSAEVTQSIPSNHYYTNHGRILKKRISGV